MKVTQKKLDGGKILFEGTASVEDVDRAFNYAAFEFANQMGLKPKANMTVQQACKEELGITDLDAQVQGRAIELIGPMVLDKKDISPLFAPTPMPTSEMKRGQKFTFTMTVTLKPDYDLKSYDPIEMTVQPFVPDLSTIDKQIADMADQYAGYEASGEDHPIAKGDTALITIEASINGEPLTGLNTGEDGRPYTAGEGYMPPEFDDGVIGMKPGETKTFSFKAPDWDEEGNTIEVDVDATVTVKELQKKVKPTIDDEWVRNYYPMYRSLDDFRHSMEDNMIKAQREQYEVYLRNQAAYVNSQRFQGKLPDEAYEATAKTLQERMRAQLAEQNMTWEQFVEENGGQNQFQMLMMMETRQTLVTGLALDAVFKKKKLVVSEEDIMDACKSISPREPGRIRKELESSDRNFVLREAAERACAAKYLVEHAIITEATQEEMAAAAAQQQA